MVEELKQKIRDIPDFPKKGILFKDITTLLNDAQAFSRAIELIAERYKDKKINSIVCIEARGFIFGGALAYKLGTGLIPVRKAGKLPYKTYKATYELEYGTDTLEIHQEAIKPGERVLIIDDLLATGGTTKAVANMVKQLKGEVVEVAFLIELTFLDGRKKLGDYEVFSLIKF
jgi:adenine phosphoribosyltransferase